MPCLSKAASRLTLRIRPAGAADVPELILVQQSAMRQYARDSGLTAVQATQQLAALRETAADLQDFLRQPAQVLLLARELKASGTEPETTDSREGRILGALRLQPESQTAAYLTRFVVRPDCQSTGVGRALFKQACTWLRQQSYQQVYLHTAAANQHSMHFYQSLGFRLVSQSHDRGYARNLLCLILPE
ncbi:MAG: GNAT family N-acetyltransferase [Oscillospiraceae bacterium]|nr:GNAT family N-acetyltransferase [Oscillospiraceae bacterium]